MVSIRSRACWWLAVASVWLVACNDDDEDGTQTATTDAVADLQFEASRPDALVDTSTPGARPETDVGEDIAVVSNADAWPLDGAASPSDSADGETRSSLWDGAPDGAVDSSVTDSADAVDATDGSVGATRATMFVPLNPDARQFPEGVAHKGTDLFLSMGPLLTIVRVDAQGSVHEFGSLPPIPTPPGGFLTGLEFAPSGELYVGLVSQEPTVKTGVYRVPAAGGVGALAYSDTAMSFPNDILFDASGNMFVTDSGSGIVFRVSAGSMTRWAESELLRGNQTACGLAEGERPVGANGMARAPDGTLYVANTDRGLILRIASLPDGTAAPPEVFVRSCERLRGADGLALERDGSLLVLINRRDAIERAASNGQLQLLTSGAPLDFPASIVLDTERNVGWVTNFPRDRARQGKVTRPALVRVDFDRPRE